MELRWKVAITIPLFIIATAMTCAAQTPDELKRKYGPPDAGHYLARPGIVITVTFSEHQNACKIIIEPQSTALSSNNVKPLPSKIVAEIIDELVPQNQRGRHVRDITFNEGCSSISTAEYENVIIINNISCTPGDNNVTSAEIRWKKRRCR